MNSTHHVIFFIKHLTEETQQGRLCWTDNFGCFETRLGDDDIYLVVDDDHKETLLIFTDIPAFYLTKEKLLLCDAHTLFWPSMLNLIHAIETACSLKG